MKLGCIAADRFCRDTIIELVGLAPFKSMKHMGYNKVQPGIQKYLTALYVMPCFSQREILIFKPMALKDIGDSVDII